MMFARVWLAEEDDENRLHLFVAEQLEDEQLQEVATACKCRVNRKKVHAADTTVRCGGCVLAAGSAVRLHQPAAA